ncbi:MAG: hypothetical protein NTX59_05670 [Elusimicrobia bacterium]|nr:hypothetical protein [Elusimicrobiota bacterium]
MSATILLFSALIIAMPAAAAPRQAGGGAPHKAKAESAQGKLRRVTDSQGNRYQVDEKGTVYTDGTPAPVQGRPHASVENIDYYYNKVGTLLGAGQKNDAIFMATEILNLPDANKNIRMLKYATGLTLSRLLAADDLNKFVPFVRHESQKLIIYRNRQMDLEVKYPASFESEDNFRGDPGKMTGAFIGLKVAKPEGKARAVTLAVSANVLKSSYDAFIENSLSGYKDHFKKALQPVEPPLRKGAKQYHGTYFEDGTAYQYDIIFLKHPAAEMGYIVIFVCPDKKYAELKKHYEFVVKNIKIGNIPQLKYENDLPG